MRKAFAGVRFGMAEAKENLSIYSPSYRDELVGRSLFYYDSMARENMNVRYMPLRDNALAGFDRSCAPDFHPDMKTYASMCATQEDAAKLADVCCRLRRCLCGIQPGVLSDDTLNKLPQEMRAGGRADLEASRQAWSKSTGEAVSKALQDAYFELGRRSPGMAAAFVRGMDKTTWNCLYESIQGRNGPDVTPESLARSDRFLKLHQNADAPDVMPMNWVDACRCYYFDWTFKYPGEYQKRQDVFANTPDLDGGFVRHAVIRCGRHAVFDDYVQASFRARQSFDRGDSAMFGFADDALDTFYKNRTWEVLQSTVRDVGVRFSDKLLPYVPGENFDLETVFRGCSDDKSKLLEQAPLTARICSRVFYDSNGMMQDTVDEAVDKSLVPAEKAAYARERCGEAMQSYVLSHVVSAYDSFSQGGQECAAAFVDGLSDELYQNLCGRRPVAAEISMRGASLDKSADFVPSEVMDEDGLAKNRQLDSSRTKMLLKTAGYRELLSQCMYRYSFEAYRRDDELSGVVFDGLSGKAPNETFAHIASNCEDPESARMLAHIVNLACETTEPEFANKFDLAAGSLMRDDLHMMLTDENAFSSDAVRDAFCEGLSSTVVLRLGLSDFVDESTKARLSADPVVCSEDDILFAGQQGFTSGRCFSKESAKATVKAAVSSAREDLDDKSSDVFQNTGLLSAACCGEYIDAVSGVSKQGDAPRVGLHTVLSAGKGVDDLRHAADVCNTVFNALSSDRELGVFCDLNDAQLEQVRDMMRADVMSAYENIPNGQRPKFIASLVSPARDEIMAVVPGVWSNGQLLNNIPKELAPAPGYANKLNAFGCPDFSRPVGRHIQPVFVQYQPDLGRGQDIRDLVREGSRDESMAAADAQYKLAMSCVSTYQAYGAAAESEASGKPYAFGPSGKTYSLYELAEQCNPSSAKDAHDNICVLAKAYRSVMDSIPEDDSVRARGMKYAVKMDMARSLKFLDAAGMKDDFMDLHRGSAKYGPLLREASADMQVYVNSDAQTFAGRSRPKGIHDFKEMMSTERCLQISFEAGGDSEKLTWLETVMSDYREAKKSEAEASKRNTSDLERACSGLSSAVPQNDQQLED